MRLEGGHVQVGDEIHHPHRPRDERDLVLLVPQELDHLVRGQTAGEAIPEAPESRPQVRRAHLEQRLHHAARHQRLAARVVAGQVVQEGEERRGELVGVGLHGRVWGCTGVVRVGHTPPGDPPAPWHAPIMAWMQLRTSTGRKPW